MGWGSGSKQPLVRMLDVGADILYNEKDKGVFQSAPAFNSPLNHS